VPEHPQHAELCRGDIETGTFLDEQGLRNLVRSPDEETRPIFQAPQGIGACLARFHDRLSSFLLEHDLIRKPLHTFRDHASKAFHARTPD
jgi:hypothetical protein